MDEFTIGPEVRELLTSAFLEERDFIDSLRQEKPVEDPAEPGVFQSRCIVAVRRPLDLETAQLRRLTVRMRRGASGWEVFALEGLESAIEP
jgi:hypothetical protein